MYSSYTKTVPKRRKGENRIGDDINPVDGDFCRCDGGDGRNGTQSTSTRTQSNLDWKKRKRIL